MSINAADSGSRSTQKVSKSARKKHWTSELDKVLYPTQSHVHKKKCNIWPSLPISSVISVCRQYPSNL